MQVTNIDDLEEIVKMAINSDCDLNLLVEMPGFEYPEMISNPPENLEKKLDYYKKTYNKDLEHKYSKGIKIIGYSLD